MVWVTARPGHYNSVFLSITKSYFTKLIYIVKYELVFKLYLTLV